MLAHQQVKVRKTRSTKEKPAAIKEKFVEQRLTSVVTITPKTDNQAKALEKMEDLNTEDMQMAANIVAGTARSMGVEVAS
jgi:ribosomal protein L11